MERNFEINQERDTEHEKAPRFEIWLTRHANRTPTGELTAEGHMAAEQKGKSLSGAEVVKGYSSRESTDRAYKTAQVMSEASETKSVTGDAYATRRRRGLFYDMAGPLVKSRISALSAEIKLAALAENPLYDPDDPQFSKLREKHQENALRKIINDPEISHIFAMGVATNIENVQQIGERYMQRRKSALERGEPTGKAIGKDLVMNVATHGGVIESFLRATLRRTLPDGSIKRGFGISIGGDGQVNFEQAMGDVITPTESIKVVHPIDENENAMAVEFENSQRFKGEHCTVDLARVHFLSEQYKRHEQLLEQWEGKQLTEDEFIEGVGKLRSEFESLPE